MKLTIEIQGDNAAFWVTEAIINRLESCNILREVIGTIENNIFENSLLDSNGSTIGHFKLSEEG